MKPKIGIWGVQKGGPKGSKVVKSGQKWSKVGVPEDPKGSNLPKSVKSAKIWTFLRGSKGG